MLSEDQYLERTPDLIAKVRAMREAAEKAMNRFTRAADYDVRRVVGRKPKGTPRPAVQLAFPATESNASQPLAPSASVREATAGSGNDAEGA